MGDLGEVAERAGEQFGIGRERCEEAVNPGRAALSMPSRYESAGPEPLSRLACSNVSKTWTNQMLRLYVPAITSLVDTLPSSQNH